MVDWAGILDMGLVELNTIVVSNTDNSDETSLNLHCNKQTQINFDTVPPNIPNRDNNHDLLQSIVENNKGEIIFLGDEIRQNNNLLPNKR